MSVFKIVRAVVGIVIVVVLGFTVMNWWNDFKAASVAPKTVTTASTQPSTTPTVTVTGVAIAQIDGVNFRAKPASSAKLIRGLKKGEKVTVLLKDGAWYKIKDAKGKTGWVTADGDSVALQRQ